MAYYWLPLQIINSDHAAVLTQFGVPGGPGRMGHIMTPVLDDAADCRLCHSSSQLARGFAAR